MTATLQQLLFESPRLDEMWHAEFGRALAADADGAEERLVAPIERRYLADPRAMDAYSRVACFLTRQGKSDKALTWFAMDANSARQTWWQRLRHAECLAGAGRLPEALALAGTVYAATPEAVNGYASIAWALREQGRMADALEWMQRDIDAHRIAPGFCLNAAVLFAEAGDVPRAVALVEASYARDTSLRDGFARLGNVLKAANDVDGAMRMYERDAAANRLRPIHRLVLADHFANVGRWADAETQIARAYEDDATLHDRFARLGNILRTRNDVDGGMRLFQLDAQANRLHPSNRLILADYFAGLGKWAEAEAEIERAYAGDSSLRDRFARLGNILRAKNDDEGALRLYERDATSERLSPGNRLVYSDLLARRGFWDEATRAVERAYAEDASLRDGFSALSKWMPAGKNCSDLVNLSERDQREGRQTDLGARMCTTAIRARAFLGVELAALSEWIPVRLDIKAQWLALKELALADRHPKEPLKILNADLCIADAQDALIQFRELVLQESYHFACSTPAPRIVDGGANIGMAIAYFKWLHPEAHIVAFEPHPELFTICRGNIERNAWKNVTLHPCALLDRDGTVTFNILPQMPMGSSVTRRLVEAQPDGAATEVTAECKRLGTYMAGPVDYLKLDIEGAETRVLRDLGDRLRQARRGFIEYHYGADDNSLGELLALLERAGFRYRLADPPAALPIHGRRRNDQAPWSCSIYFHATNGAPA